jgi:predicted amidophosphoribosyltransferase
MHIVPVRCYGRLSFFAFRLNAVFLMRLLASAAFGREFCLCCGKESLVLPLCHGCIDKLFSYTPLLNTPLRCRTCGKELVSELDVCSACRERPLLLHADGAFPLHAYRLWKKELLFAWKGEEKRALSPVFAALVHKALAELEPLAGHNCPVVPVPPRSGKIREKGWDQIDELCSFLHEGFGNPVLKLLVRRTRLQQKKLDRVQRLGTIGSAYAAAPERRIKRILSAYCRQNGREFCALPEAVVLLDDVMTTGATIETCASLLKQIGIRRVYALTLFCVD